MRFHRPAGQAWPTEAMADFRRSTRPMGVGGGDGDTAGECLLKCCVGMARLNRNEADAAAIAFKRAEAASRVPSEQVGCSSSSAGAVALAGSDKPRRRPPC
ncbi:MAG: hypothetical protein U0736_11700 [Gemmataceae bacterium]